jgi:hypothetical protein
MVSKTDLLFRNRFMKFFSFSFLVATFLAVTSFTDKHAVNEYNVIVNTSNVIGMVSPNIMGFNMVYCFEGDAAWKSGSGKIAGMMKDIGVGQFRYPGGTVVTRYHWEKPTGQGWSDILDPQFDPTKNSSPSSYMDIDEYLELTKKLKIEPLVGINMGSGIKYNRVQEGVDEAVRLMKHCLSKGVKVKYYYLDNEPYQHDANYTYKPEEYADMVNTYVPAMKKVDPDIKIIVNTQPRTDIYIKPLLEKAGKNIDMVDVHMYWKFKNATFNNWIAEPLMTHQGKGTYAQQKQIWEKLFADEGYPNIKLVVLEWNIGPPGQNAPPTETQAALMIGEQFTQYIKSGLFMSCFWPLSLPANDGKNTRPLFRSQGGYQPNKAYFMFAMYTDILGQKQVSNEVSGTRLIPLSVKSNDGKTMWVYLVNKNQDSESSAVNLSLTDFKIKNVAITGFDSDGKIINKQDINTSQPDVSHFKLNVPRNSLIKLTFNAL